jgi:lysophospholipase L1-like esterase
VPEALALALSGKAGNLATRKQVAATLALARNAVTAETAGAAKGFAALAARPDATAWLPKESPMEETPAAKPVLGPSVPAKGILVKSGDSIAFLGDSITRLGAQELGFINLVIKGLEVAGVPDVGKVPAGWDGQHSGDMLGRVDKLIAQPNVKILTVSCGVNDVWGYDWGRGVRLRDYRRNVRGIYDKAAASNVLVVAMTPTLIQEDPRFEKNLILAPYVDFIRAEAALRKLPLADCNAAEMEALSAFPPDGTQRHFTYDGVHPVWEGNKLIARTLLGALGVPGARLPEIEKAWELMKQSAEKQGQTKK